MNELSSIIRKRNSNTEFFLRIREKYGDRLANELVRDFGGMAIYIPKPIDRAVLLPYAKAVYIQMKADGYKMSAIIKTIAQDKQVKESYVESLLSDLIFNDVVCEN